MKSVAVVILNFNGEKYLSQFLPSVLNTAYDNLTIWVADNASSDDSVAFVAANYPTVKILQLSENYGFAEGYNQALKQIKADYFVLLNSDVEVTPNWVQPIIDLMETDTTIAACQPKVRAHYNKLLFEHAGGAGGWMDTLGYPFCRGRIFAQLEEDKGQYDDVQEVFWATGAALFIRAALYEEFGGLDGDYFAHMEEIDLCWRLKRAGYKIMVCPQSVVFHVGGGTLPPSNPRKTYLNFRNSLVTLLKNEPTSKLLWLLLVRMILDGVAGALFLVEGKLKNIWAILSAHGYFYRNFFKILKKRRLTTAQIENSRIGKKNETGIFRGSIVVAYYLRKQNIFQKIVDNSKD